MTDHKMGVVTQSQFGDPSVLQVRTTDRPEALPTEVLVRVKATGINPIEAFIRSGAFPMLGASPFVLGWDISGVIEEVVPGVNRLKMGDEVFGMPLFPRRAGAYAEYVAAPSRQLALKPKSIDHVHAAALSLVGLTAYQSLIEVAGVGAGQRVLIHGAAGGFGHIAVQLAKLNGAQVVATASVSKHEFLRTLGVDQIVDYNRVDFADAIQDVGTGTRNGRCARSKMEASSLRLRSERTPNSRDKRSQLGSGLQGSLLNRIVSLLNNWPGSQIQESLEFTWNAHLLWKRLGPLTLP